MKMKKKFLVLLIILITMFKINDLRAQANQSNLVSTLIVHEYYLYISGITSKDDVKALEDSVHTKEGVVYFLGNRYPVRYFRLKSKIDISRQKFESWISPKLKIEYYEEGEYEKEGAILLFNKFYPANR